ncbi:hypothetical protein NIES806_31430 [Dolichospermum compactum NIES-806]|uniref:Filamentous hemagglutinin outer membrane protein n=2 Tax=Dolichospermum compactum TaxID=136073 RepID=A0A1Z4V6P2_9CYAN|nr:hypothetical protein NIES806_31430 [Dolichospermum compactum NIES-806]
MNKLILALLTVTTIASAAVPANADNANIQNNTTTIKVKGQNNTVGTQNTQTIENRTGERTGPSNGNSQTKDIYIDVIGKGHTITSNGEQGIINNGRTPRRNRR